MFATGVNTDGAAAASLFAIGANTGVPTSFSDWEEQSAIVGSAPSLKKYKSYTPSVLFVPGDPDSESEDNMFSISQREVQVMTLKAAARKLTPEPKSESVAATQLPKKKQSVAISGVTLVSQVLPKAARSGDGDETDGSGEDESDVKRVAETIGMYHGTSDDDVVRYRDRLELEAGNLNEQKKMRVFRMTLGGRAREWLESTTCQDAEDHKSPT